MFAYCNNSPAEKKDTFGGYPIAVSIDEDSLSPSNGKSEETQLYCSMYQEHRKRGTKTPSNKDDHQKGQRRKKKDQQGEKGDARRKQYRNYHFEYNDLPITSPVNTQECSISFWDRTKSVGEVVFSVIALGWLLGNDLIPCGEGDDGYIPFYYDKVFSGFQLLFS